MEIIPGVPVSPHALFGVVAALLAMVSGWKVYRSYLEHGNSQVRDFSFVYLAIGVDTYLLIVPALLWSPGLLPLFLSLSSFFFFTGLAFYSRVISQFVQALRGSKNLVFGGLLVFAVLAAGLTYAGAPSMEFDENGWVRYHFPPFLQAAYLVFAVLLTSVSSGLLFLLYGAQAESPEVRQRGFLLGLALFLVGIGIILGLVGDRIYYNFFVVAAFLVFFIGVSLEKDA